MSTKNGQPVILPLTIGKPATERVLFAHEFRIGQALVAIRIYRRRLELTISEHGDCRAA